MNNAPIKNILLTTFRNVTLLKFFLDEQANVLKQAPSSVPHFPDPSSTTHSSSSSLSSSSHTPKDPSSIFFSSSHYIPSLSSSQNKQLYDRLDPECALNKGLVNVNDLLIIHQILTEDSATLGELRRKSTSQTSSASSSASSAPDSTTSGIYAAKEETRKKLEYFIKNVAHSSSTGELSLDNPPDLDISTLLALSEKLLAIFDFTKTLNFSDKFFVSAISSEECFTYKLNVYTQKIHNKILTMLTDVFTTHINRILFMPTNSAPENFNNTKYYIIENDVITTKEITIKILRIYGLLLGSNNHCQKAKKEEKNCPSSSKVTELKTVDPYNATYTIVRESEEINTRRRLQETFSRTQQKIKTHMSNLELEKYYYGVAQVLDDFAASAFVNERNLKENIPNLNVLLNEYLNSFEKFFSRINPNSECFIETLSDFMQVLYNTTNPHTSSSQQNDIDWTIDIIFIKNLLFNISRKLSTPTDSPSLQATAKATLPLLREENIPLIASENSTPPPQKNTTSSHSKSNISGSSTPCVRIVVASK